MANQVFQRIRRWYSDLDDGQEIQDVNVLVMQLAEELFRTYEPTQGAHPSFWERLDQWINHNLNEEQQKLLFRMIPYIFYVGPQEIDSLHRVAFNGAVGRWLIDDVGLRFDETDIERKLRDAVGETWFCPITDSFRINAFYHLNNIAGRDLRPDWRSLTHFTKPQEVLDFVQKQGIKRIVLLEDFVGSGSQISDAVVFAASLSSTLPILVVPLIICEAGIQFGTRIEQSFPHVRFIPVLPVLNHDCLQETPFPGEPPLYAAFRAVVRDSFSRVSDGLSPVDTTKVSGPFGFANTGSMVVLWTNCPDNTLPLIHQKSRGWDPLFPRASRL
jgi:hypothetical protein